MTSVEQDPAIQNQEALDPAAQEMQRRIDAATPQEVHDGLLSHAAEIAGRTKAIESARSQGRDVSEDAFLGYMDDAVEFQATTDLYQEWSRLGDEGRPSFKDYVAVQDQRSHDSEGNAIGDARRAGTITSALSWMDSNFDRVMRYSLAGADRGDIPKRPEAEFGLASGYFTKHKWEYGNKLTAMERAFQQEQARQKQEAANSTAQQEVAVDEARKSTESVHEQSELTGTVVTMGKGKTFVHANFKRGFADLGDMDPADAKRLKRLNQLVGATFGTDRMPAEGWRKANAESVLFMPVIERSYETKTREVVVEKRRFGRDVTRQESYEVPVEGSEHQKLVTNPETGQQEPAVLFRYDFDGRQLSGLDAHQEGMFYQEYAGGRGGAMLQVAVELPQSVADRLLAQIKQRPAFVREVAEALIMGNTNGQVEAQDWVDREPGSGVVSMKPPYKKLEELAPDWAIAIATPKPGAAMAELAGLQAAKSMEVTKHRVAA